MRHGRHRRDATLFPTPWPPRRRGRVPSFESMLAGLRRVGKLSRKSPTRMDAAMGHDRNSKLSEIYNNAGHVLLTSTSTTLYQEIV